MDSNTEKLFGQILAKLTGHYSLSPFSIDRWKANPIAYLEYDKRVLYCNVAFGNPDGKHATHKERILDNYTVKILLYEDGFREGLYQGEDPLWYAVAHAYITAHGLDLDAYLHVAGFVSAD